jgi:glycosyltransferase involved in cell wall biosynthesis
MACGKPVLAPAYEPIEEIISHKVNGWLFKPLDSESLVEGLHALHGDADLRTRLGLAARDTIVARHTWDHRVREIENWIGMQA